MSNENLLKKIEEAVVEMEEDLVVELCKEGLDEGVQAYSLIKEGLVKGMDEVGRLYEEDEYFLPEVLMCADAFNKGLETLSPFLDSKDTNNTVKVVFGVVEGDTHDIGKNLVKIMMESSGLEVYDLGRDVPLDRFIDKAEEVGADIIGMSTLMTTTMDGMKKVIDKLSERGMREKYKVMIGGGPVSQKFADSIGADIYTKDASEAARRIKEIFKI